MNINNFYNKVCELKEQKISNTDQHKITNTKTNLTNDLNSTISWLYNNSSFSKEDIKYIQNEIKNTINELTNEPTEKLQKIKAILEHSIGVQNTKIPVESKSNLTSILYKGIDSKDVAVWKKFAENPQTHPEWMYFSAELAQIFPGIDPAEIKSIFSQLMKGVVFELSEKDLEKFRKETPAAYPTIPGGQAAANLYASTRQIVGQKTLNPYYQIVMEKLKTLDQDHTMFQGWGVDSDPSKRELSLWTGGVAVSDYASKNYRVLEKSRVGSLFNNFVMHPDWKVQYPIWNLLSEGFVVNEIERQVKAGNNPIMLNYNFRADDVNAIGPMIEIPTALSRVALSEKGPAERKVELRMIPLYNDENKNIRPITKPIKMVIDVNNFRQQLYKGADPLYLTLELLKKISIDTNKNTNPALAPYFGDIKAFCDANSYAIKDHLETRPRPALPPSP